MKMLFSKILSHLSGQSPETYILFLNAGKWGKRRSVWMWSRKNLERFLRPWHKNKHYWLPTSASFLCWNCHSAQICRGYFVTKGKPRGLQRCQPWYYSYFPPKLFICEKNSLHLLHCLEPTSLLSHTYCIGLRNHWT